MNWKLLSLPALLAFGLGGIYLLPSAGRVANSAIRMELPQEDGEWMFRKNLPSKEELEALAKDTQFSKATCFRARPGEFTEDGYRNADIIDLSIVLSGYDLNNSIHRPERCMPAQGHVNLVGSDVTIKLSNGRDLTVRRLRSTRRSSGASQGEVQELKCVTYYFFVGHDRLAHDHLQRTFMDMQDRLVRGMDQRWAYASFSMCYGRMPWYPDAEITEQEVDRKLADFVSAFAEQQIEWKQIQPRG
ncbi:exosortase-associated EpsI family protein [Luteolibacter sp. SL250]|uniref:exosortase-associated EpsI family protein n=1 Tax=Luteolibacter sp. SL250 TaxID=2995170 RepID=UPI00226E4ADB|nr:exosortase-associated EpsI family protein [Luteolibacter sp. SL250]WAC20438.1 exosortase-associated EpsI family protein [Luteolibacter sp. SL250]